MKAGWQVKNLRDISQIGTGNSAPQREILFKGGIYPFFRTSDAGRIRFGNIDKSADYLNDEGIKGLKRFPAGTILFPKSGASTFLNHRVMLAVDGFVSSHLATIVADQTQVDAKYLLYFLSTVSAQDLVQEHAYPSLNLPIISDIKIPLPPLPKQQRIITILDQAFEGIAQAIANAEKNVANVREIYYGYLRNIFAKGEQWNKQRLLDVVTRLTNGYVGPTRTIYRDSGIPYLLARHVRNNQLSFDGKTFVSEEFNLKNKKSLLKADDVLLVQSGHIGHSAVVTYEHEGHNCHAMIVITTIKEVLSGQFLSLYFNTPEMQEKFNEIRSGSTVPHLTCGEVRGLVVGIPSLETQQRIIETAFSIQTEINKLEATYQQKLKALDELRKSILHQAFSGQLH